MLAVGARRLLWRGAQGRLLAQAATAAELDGPSCSGRSMCASPDAHDTSRISPQAFQQDPRAAAEALATQLTPAQRAILASALAQHTQAHHLDERYFEDLFKAHDQEQDSKGALTRAEFQQALVAHSSISEHRNREQPSKEALKMVFLASALPFIGFGFLDNAIMLVAGEEIDHLFGAKLGLSTLASAGLGNAVADVIGVGAAKNIEMAVRKLSFIKDPKLSRFQNALPATQRAKLVGAMLGVLVGCMLGLTPLFASGSFFVR